MCSVLGVLFEERPEQTRVCVEEDDQNGVRELDTASHVTWWLRDATHLGEKTYGDIM